MPPPGKRQVDDLTRFPDPVDRFQSLDQDGALLSDIIRFAQGVTERPLEEDGSGRLNLFRVFADNRDAHGGDALVFDLSLDQSHGLIADTSGGGQQDQINLVFLEFAGDLRAAFLNKCRALRRACVICRAPCVIR